jgi:hypothetical protein
MENKAFLTSDYYTLKDVHALNTFLKELPKSNLPKENIKMVTELLSYDKSYDNLSDYVPNSTKYNEIIEKNERYELALKTLNHLVYTKEVILDDSRAELSNFTKHTITYKKTETHTNWYWSEEVQDEIGDDYDVEIDVTEHFYTIGYSYLSLKVINPLDYVRPYECKETYGESKDLIAEHLRQYHYVSSELKALQFCNRHKLDIEHFKSVFDIQSLSYYGHFHASSVKDESGNSYEVWDIKKLIEEVQLAKEKRYIEEDKYVKYPYTNYIDFLANYLNKTHFEELKS